MKISNFVERHFWLFLVAGIVLGIWNPIHLKASPFIPKVLLGLMLFLVFLKIDAIEIIENIRNYRLMMYISIMYMIIIPLFFFFSVNFIDHELAIGILLLTAMPAGVSTPALTDILKGNVPLSMSMAIVSQLLAPFTVPFLFWLIDIKGLEINEWLILRDISILVFAPMIFSQLIKRFFPTAVRRGQHLFTSGNVLVLFAFVLVTIASQREVLLADPVRLIWKVAILYVVFILLHVGGYLILLNDRKENRIAVAIGAAYMNNGMAIVLAASYFRPEVLVLMVLSELPWNTLLAPFKKLISLIK
jgi:BASS family bile acid:Na+ symporter